MNLIGVPSMHTMYVGVAVRMGRADEEVRGGACAHVVAGEPGAGFSHGVRTYVRPWSMIYFIKCNLINLFK